MLRPAGDSCEAHDSVASTALLLHQAVPGQRGQFYLVCCCKGEKQLKISRDYKHGMKPGSPVENFIAVVTHSGA